MAISLNANFEAENEKATNKPVVLVKLPDTETDTEKDSVWGTNESESQVDYTSGSVILDAQNSPAAALNAVVDAIGPNSSVSMPWTAEKIWKACKGKIQ